MHGAGGDGLPLHGTMEGSRHNTGGRSNYTGVPAKYGQRGEREVGEVEVH